MRGRWVGWRAGSAHKVGALFGGNVEDLGQALSELAGGAALAALIHADRLGRAADDLGQCLLRQVKVGT